MIEMGGEVNVERSCGLLDSELPLPADPAQVLRQIERTRFV